MEFFTSIPASERIQDLLLGAPIPREIEDILRQSYASLGENSPAVAVRSSANAEDLPEMSFAGQQETFLNVLGGDALIDATRRCWASLWTARALSYRHKMGIDHGVVAMAVVVQKMVLADVSGILFTANPATGERSEILVNANFGLGESIVGGEVTPDTYILDRGSLDVTTTRLGSKTIMTVVDGVQGTGVGDVPVDQRDEPSLTDDQLRKLGSLALEVETLFAGVPQDVEWAIENETVWLLQSRPITHLPPQPLKNVSWNPPTPDAYLARSQLVEHIPDPVSPLFEDLHMCQSLQEFWGRNLVRAGRHRFEDTQPPKSFVLQTTVNGYAYRQIGEPPRTEGLAPPKPKSFLQRKYAAYDPYLNWPRRWKGKALPAYLATISEWRKIDIASATDDELLSGIRELSRADARYWYGWRQGAWFAFALTRGTEFRLMQFLDTHAPDQGFSTGLLLSGLPSRALSAQESLWRIAKTIKENESLRESVIAASVAHLSDALEAHPDGGRVLDKIQHYFDTVGQQIYTLDFAEPSQAEDQLPILRNLQAMVVDSAYDPMGRKKGIDTKAQCGS